MLIILMLQLIWDIREGNNKITIVLQALVGVCGVVFYNQDLLIFFIPIIVFGLLCNMIRNNIIILLIQIIVILLLSMRTDVVVLGYTCLMHMYLAEIKKEEDRINAIKNLHKNSRNMNYNLTQKIFYYDKYIEQSKVLASLNERNYIAQKMHDSLGHRITGSIMQLEVTREVMDTNMDLSKQCLNNAIDNLKEGMDEIRGFLKNIKPKSKDISIESIRELLQKFQFETSILTNLNIQGSLENVKPIHMEVITENIKEAMTNICKYSSASRMSVSFFVYGKVLRVEIKDNGVGCKKVVKNLGLIGMEERMQKINGKIGFSSDNGFLINMVIILEG